MKNFLIKFYTVLRAPLVFLASFVGLILFWIAFVALLNVVPSAGLPMKEFMDFITLFIWRSDENINFFRNFAIALNVFYPAVPGLALLLVEFFYKVYKVRVLGHGIESLS
jgi:hypothetical protein